MAKADKTDKPAAPETVRVRVRIKAGGPGRRYRAGLGPFGRDPVEVEATAGQAAALEADPTLIVERVGV